MSSPSTPDIAIDIATSDQLFNAPPINPFSEKDVELLGVSGLSVLVRQLQLHRRDRQHARVVIRLPADHITPGFEAELVAAIRRYCRAKIADNDVDIHLIRRRSSLGLGILAALVLVIVGGAYLLFTTAFSGLPQAVAYLVGFSISLFSWVTLWDVLEALLFNPIPLLRENACLRKLIDLDVVVEPERGTCPTDAAQQYVPERSTPLSPDA